MFYESKSEFVRFIMDVVDQLRTRVNEYDVVEQVLLLMIMRRARSDLVSTAPLSVIKATESFDSWFETMVDSDKGISDFFRDYLAVVSQKVSSSMEADKKLRVVLFEFWCELLKFPFDGMQGNLFLGECYEEILLLFAEKNIGGAGYSYTPRGIVDLMVKMLEPKDGQSIYDPVCGSGGFLTAACNYVRQAEKEGALKVCGREMSAASAFIGKGNFYVNGLDEADLEVVSSLSGYDYAESIESKFDLAIANPPFSLREWDDGGFHGYLKYGIPPRSNADYAFVQNLLFSLNKEGRAAIVVPMGLLFRGGSEKSIRMSMLENNHIEAIVAIPPQSFYGTSIPANILVLKRFRESGDVFFVDANDYFVKDRGLNRLDVELSDDLLRIVKERKSIDGKSRLVTLEEIAGNEWSLTFSRYLSRDLKEVSESLDDLFSRQKILLREFNDLQNVMEKLVGDLSK